MPGDYIPAWSRLFHITDNPGEAGRASVGESVLADPGRAYAVLANAVTPSNRPMPPAIPKLAAPQAGTVITADFLHHAINEARPADSILVQESLSTLKTLRQLLPTGQPGPSSPGPAAC